VLEAKLSRRRQEARLNNQNRATLVADIKAQQKILTVQIENARLMAQKDAKVQKCLILAKVGLDCDGHRAPIIVGGGGTRSGG
jgi:hypothetical protein